MHPPPSVVHVLGSGQNGRSSLSFVVAAGWYAGCGAGCWYAGCCGTGACACACGLSTFHAVMLLNHRPLYSLASMSICTLRTSPIWMLNAFSLSSPNTLNTHFFGYCSCVSSTNSCDFHAFPVLCEIPPFTSHAAIILPVISMFVKNLYCWLLLNSDSLLVIQREVYFFEVVRKYSDAKLHVLLEIDFHRSCVCIHAGSE